MMKKRFAKQYEDTRRDVQISWLPQKVAQVLRKSIEMQSSRALIALVSRCLERNIHDLCVRVRGFKTEF